MSCILRISGNNLDVVAMLEETSLEPDSLWKKGEPRFRSSPDNINKSSGVRFVVSEAGFDALKQQIEDAIEYFKEALKRDPTNDEYRYQIKELERWL